MVFIDQVRNHAPGLSEKHQNFPCVGQSQNAPIPEPADQIKRAATNQQTVPKTPARRPRHLEKFRAQKILIINHYQLIKCKNSSNSYPKYHHHASACHHEKSRCEIPRPAADCDQIGTAQL
jgi:hypothetical protein